MIYKTTRLCYRALSKAGYFPLSSPSLVLCKTSLPHRKNIRLSASRAYSSLNTQKCQAGGKHCSPLEPSLTSALAQSVARFVFVLTTGQAREETERCLLPFYLPNVCSTHSKHTNNSAQEPLTSLQVQGTWQTGSSPLTLAIPSPPSSAYSTLSTCF